MNIAILGYGIEGESAYHYFRSKYPDAIITAYDNNHQSKNPLPHDVTFVGDRKDFKGIDADLAIKTPAIPPWNVEVTGEVTSITREFIQQCPAPIIGVTGTKGKGTTASFITAILEAARKRAWLVGNIGVGALDVLRQIKADDIVIYELSSFQLWDIDVSPHVAVLLGIEPEHLDAHKDMNDYVMAKANITLHQSGDDRVIYRAGNRYTEQIVSLSKAQKIAYPSGEGAHIKDGMFFYGEQELCSTSAVRLPGNHNKDNACAAISAVWQWVTDGRDIERGLQSFDGLPHRLKFVRSVGGVDYFDDSIGTTPGSSIAALSSFQQPKVIILGGSSKGADFGPLIEAIKSSDVRRVILIGDEGKKIEQLLKESGIARYSQLGSTVTMDDIVREASTSAATGDIVILSPACASFDMFKNYADRGDQFIAAVNSLS